MVSSQPVPLAPTLFLDSPKRKYCKGEKVIVIITIANLTRQALVFNRRLQMVFDYKYREAYELRFYITGPSGALIAPCRVTEDRLRPYPEADDFVELSPGEQLRRELALSAYFDFSQVGEYKIVAEYHNDHDGHQFGLTAWTGEVYSSPMEVVIVPASDKPT